MLRLLARVSTAVGLLAVLGSAAGATPNCLKGQRPFNLAGDTVSWSMTIAPGANCIQGLRWSYMQIADLSIADQPKNGTIVLVGPAFRYYSNPDFPGSDRFTLVVSGKNRHTVGQSTVEIVVTRSAATLLSQLAHGNSQPERQLRQTVQSADHSTD